MTYSGMKAILALANQFGLKKEGYITYTADSFCQYYPVQSRTFIVSSENKQFQKDSDEHTLFGSSLDGQEKNVRLDVWGGNPDSEDWEVEECGVLSYELTEVNARKLVVVGIYDTHDDAYRAMLARAAEVFECSEENAALRLKNAGDLAPDCAWVNDVVVSGDDYDWNIIRLFNDGQSIKAKKHEPNGIEPRKIRGQREFEAKDIVFNDEMLLDSTVGCVGFYLCVPDEPGKILGREATLWEEKCGGKINLYAFYDIVGKHVTDYLCVEVAQDDIDKDLCFYYYLSDNEKKLFEAKMHEYNYDGCTLEELCKEYELENQPCEEN